MKKNDFVQSAVDLTVLVVRMFHQFLPTVNDKGEEDELLLLDVSSSSDVVHAMTKDEAFLRVGDETKRLTHEQRMQLEYEKGARKFEEQLVLSLTEEEIDLEVLEEYQQKIRSTTKDVLMFAKNPTYKALGSRVRFFKYERKREKIRKFPAMVNKENIQNTRYSRNPAISRVLTELEHVREQNEGVERIFGEMKANGLPEPEYRETDGAVVLVLRNVEKKNLNDKGRKTTVFSSFTEPILELIREKGSVSRVEIENYLGVGKTAAYYQLNKLVR